MNAAINDKESARITWKDALIILFLIFYAWFAYDENDSSHRAKPHNPAQQTYTP